MEGPTIGPNDEFEAEYTERFRSLLRPYGEFLVYERDRCTVDLGLHLTRPRDVGREVTANKVWFQLKGLRASSFSAEEFGGAEPTVPIDLPVRHLHFWYNSPEAVYVVLYIEAVELFLAEDARVLVERRFGYRLGEFLNSEQKSLRVHLKKNAIMTQEKLRHLYSHRSMRVDGPAFRGRPLGHRLDPFRCMPKRMAAERFEELVKRLLEVHSYMAGGQILIGSRFRGETKQPIFETGTLHNTFEWVPQITTQFGYSCKGGDFRVEGKPQAVQGVCAVLVDSTATEGPPNSAWTDAALEELRRRELRTLLVFANVASLDYGYMGSFTSKAGRYGISCMPQLLGDIAFNLLLATNVYLEFREHIDWEFVAYLRA
jgi:hypothetical protein